MFLINVPHAYSQILIYVFAVLFCISLLMDCLKADMRVTQKSFNFAKKLGLPFYFVSAADGTNVVKVVFKQFLFKALRHI